MKKRLVIVIMILLGTYGLSFPSTALAVDPTISITVSASPASGSQASSTLTVLCSAYEP